MTEPIAHNYEVIARVDNFKSSTSPLIFSDFTITEVRQGPEAAEWRRKLYSRRVPRYILTYIFHDYIPTEDDLSGYDGIIKVVMDTLLCLRLYRIGDVAFNDLVIKDIETGDSVLVHYRVDDFSHFVYEMEENDVVVFDDFKAVVIEKPGFRNEFFKFAAGFFMSGADRRFSYNLNDLRRIVDYIICLESLFLIGGKFPFLRSTIAKRVATFLEDTSTGSTVKNMYDERSNIVHGNNLGLSELEKQRVIRRIRDYYRSHNRI